jgi:signal transduction histidine kinase/CheY-like chemotaxis protein/HPt (histidine-containing phosphotransfer) domain-containing protein
LGIEGEDQAEAPRLPGRRAELVFAYLAAEHHRTVSRDELADALWPDMLPSSWAAALRSVVTDVRRFLDSAGLDSAEMLASTRGGYQLRIAPDVVVDLDEARGAFAAARDQLAAGLPAGAATHAERACALARLPFLPVHEGEWVDGVRRELETMHTRALELQVRAHTDAGDPRAAADAAERLVRAVPLSEAAHQLRIRALGEGGDLAGIVAAYEHCRAVLASELGVQPSEHTEALLRDALARRPTPDRPRPAAGDYAERADVRAVSELEHVAGAFNEMAGSVESDVAARERAERDAVEARLPAEHASRAESTFPAAMSHEIRTSIIGVTGMLEVLGQTELTAEQRQMVATAESSAQSLLQIIGGIFDFAKIEAGRLEIAATTFAIRPLTQAAVEKFVHIASTKGLLLSWSADERLAEAHVGDPLRVRQIITNLLSNAVKFTEVGGVEVSVRVLEESSETQTVDISVTDTGVGAPAELQQRLFAEVSQAETSTAQRFGGAGLGLIICKRLVALIGGDLTLESAPGMGTTVRLIVPMPVGDLAAIDPEPGHVRSTLPTARPKPSRAHAQREGGLLLLAEDHPVNRTVLTHQLDLVGFHTDTADDGQDAFEKYLSGRYALVMTDLNMPRMDGYELARAIRRHEEEHGLARTPVVALTANVTQGELAKCAEAGMDDFAAKPTTIPVLASKLHRWLPALDWPVPETVPDAGESGAVLDSAVLVDLTGGEPGFAASMLDDFVETSRRDMRELADAAAAHDHEQMRRQAHRLVGAGRVVGAVELVALAKQIEDGAAAGSDEWARVGSLVERLEAALDRIAEAVPT